MPSMDQTGLSVESVASRSGATADFVRRLQELGLLADGAETSLTDVDVRRVRVVAALDGAGLSIEGLAQAVRMDMLSLDFVEQPS
jgi:hypothetical protein